MSEPVGTLLAKARTLREGRDQWRTETARVLAALRASGMSIDAIADATGIPKATAARLSRTSGRAPSRVTA